MKRIVTLLLLFALLLAPAALAAPTDEDALNLRIIYTVKSQTLGDTAYTIYCNALAFPIAQDDEAMYLLTDASLYNFSTATIAAAEEISAIFEKSGITGIKPEDLAAEFKLQSVDIAIIYQNKVYDPVIMYSTESYALLMLNEAPDIAIPAYTESLPDKKLSFFSTDEPGFGIDTAEPALTEKITRVEANVSDASAYIEADKGYAFENLGSPILNEYGTICGIIYYDDMSREIVAAGLGGLQETLDLLGIEVNPIGGSQDPATAPSTTAHTTSKGAVSTTTAARISTSDKTPGSTPTVRTFIIYATCLAGILLIVVIVLMILRMRSSRPDREVEQLRKDEIIRSADSATASQTRTAAAAEPPVRKESERILPRKDFGTYNNEDTDEISTNDTRRIPTAAPKPADDQPPRSIMLAVLDGNLQGYTLNVTDTAILGRDPHVCQIVFGATQTEVSRRHCQITYRPQSGEIILEDLNSANGTYTPDGRRFAAERKYLLRVGDRFCLGTKDNMVEVR